MPPCTTRRSGPRAWHSPGVTSGSATNPVRQVYLALCRTVAWVARRAQGTAAIKASGPSIVTAMAPHPSPWPRMTQLSHEALVEIRRKARNGRGHRTPQQIVDSGFARFHLTHRNILSLSACHGEAGGRDADTIWRYSRERQATPPPHPLLRQANSTAARPIGKPRGALQCTLPGLDRAAHFQPGAPVQAPESPRDKEPSRPRGGFGSERGRN